MQDELIGRPFSHILCCGLVERTQNVHFNTHIYAPTDTQICPQRHAYKIKTHTYTITYVSVDTTDAVWTIVFSAVKEGPEGLLSDSTPEISCDTVTSIPPVSHTLLS